MSKHRYEIKMTVPIGIRKGVITIDGDCGRIRGTLDILGHEQPFLGNIENDGSCEFLVIWFLSGKRYRTMQKEKSSMNSFNLKCIVNETSFILPERK